MGPTGPDLKTETSAIDLGKLNGHDSPHRFTQTQHTTSNKQKRSRYETDVNKELLDNMIENLTEQLQHERANSAKLNEKLDNMEKHISTLTSTIEKLNEIIANLQKNVQNQTEKTSHESGANQPQKEKEQSPHIMSDNSNATHTQQCNTLNDNLNTIPMDLNVSSNENNATTSENNNNNNGATSNGSASNNSEPTNKNKKTLGECSNGIKQQQIYDVRQTNAIPMNTSGNTQNNDGNQKIYDENEKVKRDNQIPPIVVWSDTQSETQDEIRKNMPRHSFVFGKINKGKFRIIARDSDVRQKIITFLKSRGYQFNTYTPSNEKMKNVLLKGCEVDEESLIVDALARQNISPHKVQRFTTGFMRANNIQSRIWQITLLPNTDIKVVFGIRYIEQCAVKWEFMAKPAITQCKKCQRFNHSSANCFLPYRCVKCINEHEPGMCPLNTAKNATKPKCINCKGEHAANNATECPVFKRAIEQQNQKTKKGETNKTGEKSTTKIIKGIPFKKANQSNNENNPRIETNSVNVNKPKEKSCDRMDELIKCVSENQKSIKELSKSLFEITRYIRYNNNV